MCVCVGKIRIKRPEKKSKKIYKSRIYFCQYFAFNVFLSPYIYMGNIIRDLKASERYSIAGPSLAIYFDMRTFIVTRVIIIMVMVWFRGVKDYVF